MKVGIVPSSEINESNGFRMDASYYLNKKIKCSLCGMEFDKFDPLIKERKKKHQEKHLRFKGLLSQRDGHQTQNSSTKGKVFWEDVN